MAKSRKKKTKRAKSRRNKKTNVIADSSGLTFKFKDGSHGTHLEQEKEMKHEDFPLFLRIGYEEAGEKINK